MKKRNFAILFAAAAVIALPFALRPPAEQSNWQPGDPVLIIVSPHNEAIRFEFSHAFSKWHEERFGTPVKIDWRAIGGASEINRYLSASYIAAARGWWTGLGHTWLSGAGEALTNPRFDTQRPPPLAPRKGETAEESERRIEREMARWESLRNLYQQFRTTDDPTQFSAQIDLLMGGGAYDHLKAFGEGLTVAPWPPDAPPAGLFTDAQGREMLPATLGGERWRSDTFFGTAVSTFGICFNSDRLRDLGIQTAPQRWEDLADPRYARQLGVADPTKSGSIAKAFELIIHQQCYNAIRAAGFSDADIARHEEAIATAKLPPGELPAAVPAAYQTALERGWRDGLWLVQQIGANARYFTDAASRVPIDVSAGAAAAGIAIDFYSRFQAQNALDENGRERMSFVTPEGGSSASSDPISLLRGAPHRDLAIRFIEFVLTDDGQKLWTYRPGSPGGPIKYALRRIPIRRSFFPSSDPSIQAQHEQHLRYAMDNLADPQINPYSVNKRFTYRPRWTAAFFTVHSDLIRAMCLDASRELQRVWTAANAESDSAARERALGIVRELPTQPEPVTWRSAPRIARTVNRLEYLRDWTRFYRANYARALAALRTGEPSP
ncbi:MAG: extracellular solute-binding protein [Verrucomicrobia bacterium]|nr:extracellular solute-binding protein [Kiritimatiellia bacterium]MCO6400232.1 extracellular solute-binding protein [Verrucomicrobiota bacterium]